MHYSALLFCFGEPEDVGGCLSYSGDGPQWWDILSPGKPGSVMPSGPVGFWFVIFYFLHIAKVSFSVGRGNEAVHEAQM